MILTLVQYESCREGASWQVAEWSNYWSPDQEVPTQNFHPGALLYKIQNKDG